MEFRFKKMGTARGSTAPREVGQKGKIGLRGGPKLAKKGGDEWDGAPVGWIAILNDGNDRERTGTTGTKRERTRTTGTNGNETGTAGLAPPKPRAKPVFGEGGTDPLARSKLGLD